jgi:hypothetical protein
VHSFLFSDDQLNSFGTFAPGNRQNWLREQTLERIYVSPWLLNSIINLFRKNKSMPESVNRSVRNCVDYNNQALQNILHKETSEKGKDRPVFSYTHFLLPHDPYLYDENGHEKKVLTDDNEMNNYLQQVKYANSIIRKIVSILLDDSARKKIIIIQGDHGFRNFSNSVPLQEQFRNFNAIYFPGQNYNIVATNPGMINTFRIILNNFFNSNLPLLKDSIVLPKHADTGETETDQKTVINN